MVTLELVRLCGRKGGMTNRSATLPILLCTALLVAAACGGSSTTDPNDLGNAALTAVIHTTSPAPTPGTYALGITSTRDAQLIVPANVATTCPVPTVVLLHGAGGTGGEIQTMLSAAAERGIAAIVPYSRQNTWEIATQSFGPDARNIDAAIKAADQRYCIDSAHLGIAGFSDGASYAIALGLPNGNLFSHVIAFSPGFVFDVGHRGKAAYYISHGRSDSVLPFDYTQLQIVPYLQNRGYSVVFNAFTGGHGVPIDVARAAFDWLVQ